MSNPLERLQLDALGRLQAAGYFVDIGVFLLRPRADQGFVQIQSRIDQLLNGLESTNGKYGAAVTVLMPLGDATDPNVPGPRLRFSLIIRVQEIPMINMGPTGTGKSAEEIALQVLALLHHFSSGMGQVLVAANDALTPVIEKDDPRLTYDVKFTLQTGLAPAVKVAPAMISPAGGVHPQTVTLTCATPSASIYYTLDGSYPTDSNPSALLYTAPFAVNAAAELRAAAELAGANPSDVTRALFT